ncbi:hypothetical protein IF1G_11028 [Cordyceps javanica]|uniref:Chromo domain-containing protein n=1 Tax=Cordyceps javanica TaxID=43265 RepID=A0A545VJ92_9HYPO|nr:hypothetical protein IF1G_11028 [Cordyceps javanica]TQW01726.1 hypothetical protein IF2G_10708 [Cordyceps javanica]
MSPTPSPSSSKTTFNRARHGLVSQSGPSNTIPLRLNAFECGNNRKDEEESLGDSEPSPISSEPACEEQAAPSSPGEAPSEQALPEMLQCTGYEWETDTHVLWLLIKPADANEPPLHIREAHVHHGRPRWLLQHWKNNERPVNPNHSELFEPLRIVRAQEREGTPGFRVQFVGFDASKKNLGWLSEDDIAQCALGLLDEYQAQPDVSETKRTRTVGQAGASRRRPGRARRPRNPDAP